MRDRISTAGYAAGYQTIKPPRTTNQNPQPLGNLIPLVIDPQRRIIRTQPFKLPLNPETTAIELKICYFEEVERRNRDFIDDIYLDNRIRKVVSTLTTPGSRFGMVICGQTGNGKSTMARAVKRLLDKYRFPMPCEERKQWYLRINSARHIFEAIKDDHAFSILCECPMLAIDDLGTEPIMSKIYGTDYHPIEYLLEERYERMHYTIITTNILPSKLRDRYGPRVADRFNEMMHLIEFSNPSYRMLPDTVHPIVSDDD